MRPFSAVSKFIGLPHNKLDEVCLLVHSKLRNVAAFRGNYAVNIVFITHSELLRGPAGLIR